MYGQACTTADECRSGNCVDGVCCNTGCDVSCQACNIEGSLGTCSNVAAGADDGSDCNGANVCDGKGACKLAPTETCATDAECASGNCLSIFVCSEFPEP
ncbi:hypothetical protein WMF37_21660 [Sorangium sp. So ce291]|uniref:hypothetical protein n=1 Tax=Sorangium sp. So ce291 TaxID=3133294 RepID=UPI003F5FB4BC